MGTNTNLGIILLCAPLAVAAEGRSADLRAALAQVLESLDIQDAELAFRAIARAAPAGLGRVEPTRCRRDRDCHAQSRHGRGIGRDRIAHQYVSDFEDVFERGEPVLEAALARAAEPKWATLAVYLEFLSAFPDSHIARKHGIATAEDICRTASRYHQRMRSAENPAALLTDLLAWDALLKERGINPGTSADLTVATLFAHRLRTILPSARNND